MVEMDLEYAHRRSIRHRAAILGSVRCGCFYCLSVFPPSEITDWIDEEEATDIGQTALCPRCGIDSVLAELPTAPLTFEFLERMERRFFGMLSAEQRQSARERFDQGADRHPAV
jgi:hypothetical protein